MKECSFGQLVGCPKCLYEGDCYDERIAVMRHTFKTKRSRQDLINKRIIKSENSSDELFRKALMVEGE